MESAHPIPTQEQIKEAAPAPVRKRPRPSTEFLELPDDLPEPGFFKKYRLWIGAGVLAVAALGFLSGGGKGKPSAPVKKEREMPVVKVQLPPPPPPPPPPKVQPPPPKNEKPMEQAAKPEPKPEAPVEKPPEGLGTNNKGPGPGLAGLGTSGNGVLGGTGSGNGAGSAAAWYGARVKNRIADILKRNQKTRTAKFRAEVKLWPDATGRVEKVQMVGSTGNKALDDALTGEVLAGLQLEPPPAGVRMPIRLALNVTRPN